MVNHVARRTFSAEAPVRPTPEQFRQNVLNAAEALKKLPPHVEPVYANSNVRPIVGHFDQDPKQNLYRPSWVLFPVVLACVAQAPNFYQHYFGN